MKTPRAAWLLVPAAAAVLFLALQPATGPGSARLSGPAPEFRLARLEGGLASLSDHRGQVVFLNFWATWCPECEKEMPALEDLYRRHREKGFAVLAVSLDEGGRRALAPFAAKNALSFPILLADSKVALAYRVIGLPTAYLIDASGVVVRRYAGPLDPRSLENDILRELHRRRS